MMQQQPQLPSSLLAPFSIASSLSTSAAASFPPSSSPSSPPSLTPSSSPSASSSSASSSSSSSSPSSSPSASPSPLPHSFSSPLPQSLSSSVEASGPVGHSRFSKPLPSLPGFDQAAAPDVPPMTTEARSLPRAHSYKSSSSSVYSTPPPPPPAKDNEGPRQPLGPRLPALPHHGRPEMERGMIKTPPPPPPPHHHHHQQQQSSAASTMTMPRRRPVGAATSQPRPVEPPLPPTSPADSLASLLSAYSRKETDQPESDSSVSSSLRPSQDKDRPTLSGDRNYRSADQMQSTNPSLITISRPPSSPPPHRPASPANPQDDQAPRGLAILPAPPPKGHQSGRRIPSPPQSQPPVSDLAAPSPTRAEIWRRRPHVIDRSRDPPLLKLDHSHGSTVASSSASNAPLRLSRTAPSSPLSSPPPPPPPAKWRTDGLVGLPGRNVRPPPKEQREQPAETLSMAEGVSGKLRRIKASLHRARSAGKNMGRSKEEEASPPPTVPRRPPTPEYQREDLGPAAAVAAPVETVASPVTPASSAASAKDAPTQTSSQKLLPPSPPRYELEPGPEPARSISRKKVPPPSTRGLATAASMQDLRTDDRLPTVRRTSPGQESVRQQRRPVRQPSETRAEGPMKPVVQRPEGPRREMSRCEGQPVEVPKREAPRGEGQRPETARPDMQRAPDRPRRPTIDSGSRIVQSETQGPLYRGRDGTLYPEMRNLREPDPMASYFPTQTERLPELGPVIPARPLRDSHFNCYQDHRTMNRRLNRNYPLTCQTCDKADTEDRWSCTFCHLRICESCLQQLNRHQRVLRRLVDELASNTPLSLSSMSRPESDLGQQAVVAN